MDYFALVEEVDGVQDLEHKPPYQVKRKPVVSIAFDKFVQVHGKEVKRHALL